ncbi:hypothetical protein EJ05DRAFT_496606 [Pseudovirgaria hyperparasitica]|uniref:Uncharacterized protein n=1 Tax=Pseudovirgaria hyperparasitica TaxID=470096 RepID=A0A6A6WHX8_9PEZI|nr:uncharacterized protein EJ05DRAFT_496606 [Pseudovirgaria hyperparasitica]KAF2761705.1 hypothetical protein EJ05DRAFT_496606 [Pseudovirgaria hyperparasitica]
MDQPAKSIEIMLYDNVSEFRIVTWPTMRFDQIFASYCEDWKKPFDEFCFLLGGETLDGCETPAAIGFTNRDLEIVVNVYQQPHYDPKTGPLARKSLDVGNSLSGAGSQAPRALSKCSMKENIIVSIEDPFTGTRHWFQICPAKHFQSLFREYGAFIKRATSTFDLRFKGRILGRNDMPTNIGLVANSNLMCTPTMVDVDWAKGDCDGKVI